MARKRRKEKEEKEGGVGGSSHTPGKSFHWERWRPRRSLCGASGGAGYVAGLELRCWRIWNRTRKLGFRARSPTLPQRRQVPDHDRGRFGRNQLQLLRHRDCRGECRNQYPPFPAVESVLD